MRARGVRDAHLEAIDARIREGAATAEGAGVRAAVAGASAGAGERERE
jgi:hypothetical protein